MSPTRAEPRKFTFDQRFDDTPAAARANAAPKPKRFYTPEEFEAAKAEAYEMGRGSLEAIAAQTQTLALSQIAEAAMTALRTLDAMAAEAHAEALKTGIAAARRIAETALSRYPMDIIEQTVAACLAQVAHESRIVIRVAPDVAEVLKTRLPQLADDVGFAGRIVVTPEPRLRHADCRLEWTDGGVERSADAIAEKIEDALARFVESDERQAANAVGA